MEEHNNDIIYVFGSDLNLIEKDNRSNILDKYFSKSKYRLNVCLQKNISHKGYYFSTQNKLSKKIDNTKLVKKYRKVYVFNSEAVLTDSDTANNILTKYNLTYTQLNYAIKHNSINNYLYFSYETTFVIINSKIIYCFDPNGILIKSGILSRHLENGFDNKVIQRSLKTNKPTYSGYYFSYENTYSPNPFKLQKDKALYMFDIKGVFIKETSIRKVSMEMNIQLTKKSIDGKFLISNQYFFSFTRNENFDDVLPKKIYLFDTLNNLVDSGTYYEITEKYGISKIKLANSLHCKIKEKNPVVIDNEYYASFDSNFKIPNTKKNFVFYIFDQNKQYIKTISRKEALDLFDNNRQRLWYNLKNKKIKDNFYISTKSKL